MLRRITPCIPLLLGLLSGCEEAPTLLPLESTGLTNLSEAPPRIDPWSEMTTEALWTYAARTDTSFTVGVKRPGAHRGIYRGTWMLSPATWNEASSAVARQPGVQVIEVDGTSPTLRIGVKSAEVLARLRDLPFIDFVEPAILTGNTTAAGDAYEQRSPSGPLFSSSSSNGPNYGHYFDATGNRIPNIYTGMRIPEAWQLSTGVGVTIGLLDTGVELNHPQLSHWSLHKASASEYLTDTQGHGTHMAGVIGGRPGQSYIVGVGHGATHLSVKHSNHFLNVDTWRIAAALDTAVVRGAKVINMSFRSENSSNAVSDRIEKYYDGENAAGVRYDVLFVAAAGSGGTVATYWWAVIFPASHPYVIAVSAINYDDLQIYSGSHHGYQVELSAFHGQPTTGTSGENYIGSSSNSSNASAIVTGVASLVRSRYPHLRNDQVRTRLRNGARDLGPVGRDSYYGFGIVNAYAAVGGFYRSTLVGNVWHDHCSASIPSVTCFVNYSSMSCFTETFRIIAYGDGPFTYQWSTGSTSDQTTMTLCPSYGYQQSLQVTVTDGLQNRSQTHTAHIWVDAGGGPNCDPNLDPMCPM